MYRPSGPIIQKRHTYNGYTEEGGRRFLGASPLGRPLPFKDTLCPVLLWKLSRGGQYINDIRIASVL
nr:hypothetical protein [Cressdnaviricota sp.]